MCLNYPGVCKEAYVKECKAIVFLASGFKGFSQKEKLLL